MALQLLMRWGCKEKVKFRDFVHSEIVRPPVPTTGHELFIIEIVHHIRLARATPYKTLDPDHATTHAARHGHGSSLYKVSSPFARVDGRLLKKVTRQVTEGRFVEQKRSPGHRPILRSIPSIHLDSFLGPPSIVRSSSSSELAIALADGTPTRSKDNLRSARRQKAPVELHGDSGSVCVVSAVNQAKLTITDRLRAERDSREKHENESTRHCTRRAYMSDPVSTVHSLQEEHQYGLVVNKLSEMQ
ncbi:hypothetical protein E4U46_004105 [Claviceps purpurea]|nr:hypothetical protein E4U46_004105 [Claviceps purpurea]